MELSKILLMGAFVASINTAVHAAVSEDETKQLGANLTLIGAEKAGNADGTIPAYTGGLTSAPASFKKGSGVRTDPFVDEKPVFSITAENVEKYKDNLTESTKELISRYPDTYRVDVYPTHRTAAFPKYVLDNTLKNATSATTSQEGQGLATAYAGYPFPIPKTGNEVMWNHLLRYVGQAYTSKYDTVNVDSSGRATLATTGEITLEYPIYDPKNTGLLKEDDIYYRLKINYKAPARRAGEAIMSFDYINPMSQPRKAWQYLPGQRRVKLAPSVSYDTPNPGTAGITTYDDSWIFNGALDRFDFKLVGKKEVILPYNNYQLIYSNDSENITTPNHINPNNMRWERHRVWIVEATLKPGKRHIYAKRVFYVDEDSWVALASDQYDNNNDLYRGGFLFIAPSYDIPAPQADSLVFYDFSSGSYSLTGANLGRYIGARYIDPLPELDWSPDALAGSGIR